jgi:hypothetical protein
MEVCKNSHMTKRVLKVFVGYQIKSKFHTSQELKDVLNKKVAARVKKMRGVKVQFKFGDRFSVGKFLFTQVQEAINECEVGIFDISENTPNVMLELGMSMGANKFTIALKNKKSSAKFQVPSDIQAFLYLPYSTLSGITESLVRAIVDYNDNHTPSHLYFHELWKFKPRDKVYIICPELTEPDKRQNPEENEFLYLGKYGDIDSLLILYTSLSKLYPSIDIIFCTSKEFKNIPGNPYAENLVLVGGPYYNEITRHYLTKHQIIPYKFKEMKGGEIGLKIPTQKGLLKSNFSDDQDLSNVLDHGFFVRTKNPQNHSKSIIMINGIHTYGVVGAAKCFSLHQDGETEVAKNNCKRVVDLLGNDCYFGAHFQVNNIGRKTSTPSLDEVNIIRL